MARTKAEDTPEVTPIPRPRIDVLDRSLADPFGIPSVPIALKEKGFVCRWLNTELKGGSQLHFGTEHGYLKVRPEYLADPESFQWQVSPDGYVTRGERHREILMYTTIEHAEARTRKKTEDNLKKMRSTRQDVIQAAGEKFGDEAANYLQGRPVGSIEDTHERIERTPEAD